MPQRKHLTLDERNFIQTSLSNGDSFKKIARNLDRDSSTISKEVNNRALTEKKGAPGRHFHDCIHRFDCKQYKLCEKPGCKKEWCRFCPDCMDKCKLYEKESCPELILPPYVCNNCKKRLKCTLEKKRYDAKTANSQYEENRSESRSGPSIEEDELARINKLISPLLKNGQSVHHVFSSHASEIMLSEKTIYNYIDMGLLDIVNLDLPRKVRFRPRKNKKPIELKVEKACRIGRTYVDFLKFIEANPDIHVVQMDSVEGKKGGKVLLTIHFTNSKLMLIFLRDANTAKSVNDIFDRLYECLGYELFTRLFPVILTDNGSEFSNPSAIEYAPDGSKRTSVYYCDPSASFQKGAIENNHELIRKVVPKGAPFDSYTQEDMDILMSNINALRKKALNDKSSYETFEYFFGSYVLAKLGVMEINSDAVILKPSLLKKRSKI